MVQPMLRPETLELILAGNLPSRELERLAEAIENEPALSEAARRFEPRDELIQLLRTELNGHSLEPDDRVEDLKSRLRELREMLPREIRFPFLAPPQGPDEIGRLGIYRVRELLGEGGMGYVFLAEDPSLNRTVAVKVMKPNVAALPEHRERFLREARNAAAVEHDRVVPIFHIGEQGGIPFIAMPHLKGESLATRLNREGKLSLHETLRLGREIAEGLAAAHEKGMIHRDVQPGNVWLEAPNDRVKLLDFGLSRNTSADVHLTQPGLMLGTPAFMAPEQARNREVDSRADLFSLGILLYRMTTGRSPFDGNDLISTLISVAVDEPTPPETTPALSKLIMQLLAKKVVDRPASASEVVAELSRIEADPGRPVSAKSTKQPSRGRFRIAVAAVLFFAAALFGAYQIVLKTENGTLIVEVNDPAIEARFKDGEVKLYDSKGELKYSLKPSERNKMLPPGQYRITVTGADGLKLDSDQFQIGSGDKVTIKVTLDPAKLATAEPKVEPKVVAKEPPVAKKDPDAEPKLPTIAPDLAAKQVAEWVIVNKGRVVVEVKGQRTEVALRSNLPTEPFQIVVIKYPSSTSISKETLIALWSLDRLDRVEFAAGSASFNSLLSWMTRSPLNQHLKELAFLSNNPSFGESWGGGGRSSIDSRSFNSISDFPAIRKVIFEDISFSTESLQSLVKALGKTEDLRLTNCGLQDDWTYDFRELKIKILWLNKNTSLSDESVKELARKTELQELNIAKTRISLEGIRELARSLPKCRIISDHGVFHEGKEFPRQPTLPPGQAERFITEWALGYGEKVTVRVKDQLIVLAPGSKIPTERFTIESLGVPTLSGFRGRSSEGEPLEEAFENLTSLPRIEFVDKRMLSSTLAIGMIPKSLPREIAIIRGDFSVPVPKSGASNPFTSTRSRTWLSSMMNSLPNVKKVVFDDCDLGERPFREVGKMPELDEVVIRTARGEPSWAQDLANLKGKRLILDQCKTLTDESIPSLIKLTDLETLSVKETGLTPEGIQQIRTKMPQVRLIWNRGTFEAEPEVKQEKIQEVLNWVMDQGGSLTIEQGGNKTVVSAKKGAFTPGPIRIHSISLPKDAAKIPDEIVELLKRLRVEVERMK